MQLVRQFRSALLLLAVFACGCSSNNEGKIEGTTWRSLPTTLDGQPLPAGALQFEFLSNGNLVFQAGLQTFKGTYSLRSGNKVTIRLDEGASGSTMYFEKLVIEGDRLTLIEPDGAKVIFEKAQYRHP